jgi:hypothetical protein
VGGDARPPRRAFLNAAPDPGAVTAAREAENNGLGRGRQQPGSRRLPGSSTCRTARPVAAARPARHQAPHPGPPAQAWRTGEKTSGPYPHRLACAQNIQIWTTSVLIGIKRMPAQSGGDARWGLREARDALRSLSGLGYVCASPREAPSMPYARPLRSVLWPARCWPPLAPTGRLAALACLIAAGRADGLARSAP